MVQIKIPKTLFDKVVSDINRPHSFALERVGFLFVKTGTEENKIAPDNQDVDSRLVVDYLKNATSFLLRVLRVSVVNQLR